MKAYLIPGNKEDLGSRDYEAVLKVYKQAGYSPEFVPIKYHYKTFDDWVEQALAQMPKNELQNSLLSGFSFGSMIALAVAAQTNPKYLFLFSLSPYFKEDMPLPENYYRWHGKKSIENFKRISFNKLTAQIKCRATIFLGELEKKKYGDKRSHEAHKKIKKNKYIIVEDAGHDITHPNYLKEIRKALK